MGYIKSHRVTYLSPERDVVVGALAPGQRTPLFTISDYRRYSWYVRLPRVLGGHSWSGIVRCEASGAPAEGRIVDDRRSHGRLAAAGRLRAPHRSARAAEPRADRRARAGRFATAWAIPASCYRRLARVPSTEAEGEA